MKPATIQSIPSGPGAVRTRIVPVLCAAAMMMFICTPLAQTQTATTQTGLQPTAPRGATGTPMLVVTGSGAFTEPAINTSIPALPGKNNGAVHGAIAGASPIATDSHSVHEGLFSDGIDLADSPVPGDAAASCPGNDKSCGWINTNIVPHASSPNFANVLNQALSDAKELELPKLDGRAFTGILDGLKTLQNNGLDFGITIGTPVVTKRFLGYAPEFGRWLNQESYRAFGFTGSIGYADPAVMNNLRERGARLYCAARTAQFQQNRGTKSMGKFTPFSIDLFGSKIDFLTVEPTLVIDGPQPYLGGPPRCPIAQNCAGGSPKDGAQAFMVPFLAGAQITPISFLPSLPEIRVPVVMVTGDSEVLTPTDAPVIGTYISGKTYQTVTHSDAILSSEVTGNAGESFLLATLGPVQLYLDLGMAFGVGQLFSDEAITFPYGYKLPQPPNMAAPPNDRLLDGMPSGWSPARQGDQTTAVGLWDEGRWAAPSSFTADTTAAQSLNVEPDNEPFKLPLSLQPYDPFLLRALEDDDRHIWNSTTFGLGAQLRGVAGGSVTVGPLTINAQVEARGSLTGQVALRHTLRDAALYANQPSSTVAPTGFNGTGPISAVTIEPQLSAQANLSFAVHLTLKGDLDLGPFGDQKVTIYDDDFLKPPPFPLGNFNSGPWPEPNRFRLGTGSSTGDPLKAPDVIFHFPSDSGIPATFASFPAGNDVDSCLASPVQNPPAPPPCAGQPPALSTPPSAQICITVRDCNCRIFLLPCHPMCVVMSPLM